MRLHVTALGLSAALALPLHAGSPEPAPAEPSIAPPATSMPAPQPRNWTGGYIGGQFGYGDLGRNLSGDGPIGGLHLGYLQDFGNGFAGGIQASYDWGDLGISGLPNRVRQVGRIGARGGAVVDDFFIYGTLGAARARVPGIGSETGPYGGIGIEYALNDSWRLGGEVLYHRFSNFAGTGLGVSATTVQARASFRF